MKRLMRLAARLYPALWRARYGDELDALVEDSPGGVRELLDLIFGAMKMHVTRGSYWKFAAFPAMIGFLVAGAIVLRMPWRYVATTNLRTTATDTEARVENVLTRASLKEMIERPSLDLYHQERERVRIEDVISLMLRNLQVKRVGNEIRIAFTYPDKEKAKSTVAAITNKLIEVNAVTRQRQAAWPEVIWHPLPPVDAIQVISGGTVPPAGRLVFVLAGIMVGLFIGLITAAALQHRRAARRVFGFALVGGAAAAALALFLPDTYVSTAVLRLNPMLTPGETAQTFRPQERLMALTRQVLSREQLLTLIQNPYLDLYPKERAGRSSDEALELMRRNLEIRMLPIGGASSISFQYPDRFKAQAVVRELVAKFVELNLRRAMESNESLPPGNPARLIGIYKATLNLEVLDAASDPQSPSSPNRSTIALLGIFAGGLLAALTMMWQRWRTARVRLA